VEDLTIYQRPLAKAMWDAEMTLSGVAGRLFALTEVRVTIITVCSVCSNETKRVESVWPRTQHADQVRRVGHGGPFLSHGVCPGENPCKNFIAHDVIGE